MWEYQVKMVQKEAKEAGKEWARKAKIADLPDLRGMLEASISTASDKAWEEFEDRVDRRYHMHYKTVFNQAFSTTAKEQLAM